MERRGEKGVVGVNWWFDRGRGLGKLYRVGIKGYMVGSPNITGEKLRDITIARFEFCGDYSGISEISVTAVQN
jgi:hypothetical protein